MGTEVYNLALQNANLRTQVSDLIISRNWWILGKIRLFHLRGTVVFLLGFSFFFFAFSSEFSFLLIFLAKGGKKPTQLKADIDGKIQSSVS